MITHEPLIMDLLSVRDLNLKMLNMCGVKGVSIISYGFKNPNNVQIWMGGWFTAKFVFGFKNPLVPKTWFLSIVT